MKTAPLFRSVDAHSGLIADARRLCTELVEGVIVTVGEAVLRRLDHDYDLPVLEGGHGRMESDGPDATSDLPDDLWFAETSAAGAGAERPAEVNVEQTAPSAGHPNTAATPRAAATDPTGEIPPSPVGSPNNGIRDVLAHIAGQHRDFHVSHTSWQCICGDDLPQGDDVMGAHERHIADHQAASIVRLIDNLLGVPNPLRDMAAADQRITTRLHSAADFFPQHSRK